MKFTLAFFFFSCNAPSVPEVTLSERRFLSEAFFRTFCCGGSEQKNHMNSKIHYKAVEECQWNDPRRRKNKQTKSGPECDSARLSFLFFLFSSRCSRCCCLTVLFPFYLSTNCGQNSRMQGRSKVEQFVLNSQRAQCIFWEHFRTGSLIVVICFPEE